MDGTSKVVNGTDVLDDWYGWSPSVMKTYLIQWKLSHYRYVDPTAPSWNPLALMRLQGQNALVQASEISWRSRPTIVLTKIDGTKPRRSGSYAIEKNWIFQWINRFWWKLMTSVNSIWKLMRGLLEGLIVTKTHLKKEMSFWLHFSQSDNLFFNCWPPHPIPHCNPSQEVKGSLRSHGSRFIFMKRTWFLSPCLIQY